MQAYTIYKNLFEYKKDYFTSQNNQITPNLLGVARQNKGIYQWGNLIDLINYYLDPRFILTRNNYDFSQYDDKELHIRTDTNGTKISNNSCTAFIGMLLPEDIRSFKIKWEDDALQLEQNEKLDTLDTLKQLERKVNSKLWNKLQSPELKFIMTINHLVRDYLNYGTSTAIYKNKKWDYIPFIRNAIGRINDKTTIAFYDHFHDFTALEGAKEKYTHNLYIQDKEGKYTLYYTTNDSIDMPDESINLQSKPVNDFDIVVSKMDDVGELYGSGCGLQVLNSIIDANMYNNCLRLNAISVYHPATVIALDYTIDKIINSYTGRRLFDSDDEFLSGDNLIKINTLPGMTYSLKREQDITPTNQQPLTVLSQPQQAFEMFKAMKQESVTEIEDKYFLSVTNKLGGMDSGPAKTNDEIQLIAQMAYQQFKGVVEPFYITTVHPMVKSYCKDLIKEVPIEFKEDVAKIQAVLPAFKVDNFILEASNLLTARTQAQDDAQFNAWISLLGSIDGAMDQSVLDKIKRKSLDYIK